MADISIDGKILVPFTQASTVQNLSSGENIKTSFGKISKFIDSIQELVSTGTKITGTIDLNTYTTVGIYTSESGSNTIQNSPSVDATLGKYFTLLVLKTVDSSVLSLAHITQIIVFLATGTGNAEVYIRNGLSADLGSTFAFDTWYRLFPAQCSSTITGSGADAQLPVSSGTVYTALQGKQNSLTFNGTYDASTNPAATVQSILDEISSDVFGIGTLLNQSNNLNSTTTPGIYYWLGGNASPVNNPKNVASRMSVIVNAFTNRVTQIVVPQGNNNLIGVYIRGQIDSGWGDWKTIETTSNYDSAPTSGSTSAVTSGGVYTAIADAVGALDVSNITENLSAAKTITALSETDGIISATASDIQIAQSQVTDLSSDLADKLELDDVFGLGTKLTTATVTTSLEPGIYYYDSSTKPSSGMPTNSTSAGKIIVFKPAADRLFQICVGSGGVPGNIFYRSRNYGTNGTWSSWLTIYPDVLGLGTSMGTSNIDLDSSTYRKPGRYYRTTKITDGGVINRPDEVTSAFVLVVEYLSSSSTVRQTIYPASSTLCMNTYSRVYVSSAWSSWYKFVGTQVASAT